MLRKSHQGARFWKPLSRHFWLNCWRLCHIKNYAITIRNCIGLLLISRSMKYSLPAEICCFIKCACWLGEIGRCQSPVISRFFNLALDFYTLLVVVEYENNDMASKFQRAVTIILMLLLLWLFGSLLWVGTKSEQFGLCRISLLSTVWIVFQNGFWDQERAKGFGYI